ncbi:glutaminyl-peptide cyclotransferase [Yeosuana sp. MJ-SS3]|uniref:Glutaminyl-peptide cyclotransferase n=1 Tax=Gilvirhabdus luticola TaxID=3079858 RepID=A0ABU3U998_9FLAO|nr:glutaminyl-peptide cyclotransferase [Yeosuana sp. MJ-SS3]MDU8886886.1 glutaminyl-peptide cyclotransferase [Yeosuana sp. MJ-SS3]
MKTYKLLLFLFLGIIIFSCGSNSGHIKSDFSINVNAKKNTLPNSDILILDIENPKHHIIDSVKYKMNDKTIEQETKLNDMPLGQHTISATVYYSDDQQTTTTHITILNSIAPKVYTFNIINEYPHDITSYTQGLEFYNGELYESTGQKGSSKLRKVDYKTGEVLKNLNLSNEFFGEGLTILNDNIYQLTWESGTGFIYDVHTFERTGSFKYGVSKEGWGLCNDSQKIYKSDGTENIWTLDPETLTEKDKIQAYTNKGKIIGLNEMEWIDGKIYANRYQKNGVAIINPKNGAIEAVIDFTSLKNKVKQHARLDVLNGIAYNSKTNTIFVTGKNWDKLFEVEIVEK